MQGTNKTSSQNLCVWACDEVGGGAEGKGDPGKQGSWWPGCYGNHCIPLPCDWCCWYEQGSAISVIIQHLRHEHCGHRTHTHTQTKALLYSVSLFETACFVSLSYPAKMLWRMIIILRSFDPKNAGNFKETSAAVFLSPYRSYTVND